MKHRRSTKRALLSSALALILCFSMLLGTTFAWFTDSVTSANNIIKSGNLDIELEYWNGTAWKDVKDSSDILTGDRWEPGYVDIAYLRLKNAGSLALKYQLGVNIVSETDGVNKAGDPFKLSDYIYFDVVADVNGETAAYATREAAMANATETTKISEGYSKAGSLEAESGYVYLALIVYMPTSVGNVANHDGKTVPQINLGIKVLATQYTSESDSFGKDYDKDATYDDGTTGGSGAPTLPASEGLEFKLNADSKSYSVTGLGTCTDTDLVIPATYGEGDDEWPVTAIGESAFDIDYNKACKSLTSVTIPDSVTEIALGAFYGCSSLKSVTIPDSVTEIGWAAFRLTALTSVTFGANSQLETIGRQAFSECSSLTSVTFGANSQLETIGGQAFELCSSLTSVTIPDSVETIDFCAFQRCSSLTSVTIPASVTTIGMYAFYMCDSLTSVTIPDSVTEIAYGAFYNCTALTSVTIPASVETIGDCAFYDCTDLTSVYYGGTETDWNKITIGWGAIPTGVTVYYYSETQPTTAGKYWHYVDGVPTTAWDD